MLVKITVTQDDIDNGVPKNCFACPIARAIRRQIPHRFRRVKATYVELYDLEAILHLQLPVEIIHRINIYDETGQMNPMEFELEVS